MPILDDATIALIPNGRGHLQLPDVREMNNSGVYPTKNKRAYPENADPGNDSLPYEELKKSIFIYGVVASSPFETCCKHPKRWRMAL